MVILARTLRDLLSGIPGIRDSVLSDAIMYNQLPVGKTKISAEIEYITGKLDQRGISSYEITHDGSIILNINNSSTQQVNRSILVFVQTGQSKFSISDRFIELKDDRAYGAGIADNSLAVSALLNLGEIIIKSGIETTCNLVFLFAGSSGENISPSLSRYIVDNRHHVSFGLEINGIHLGSIGYRSIGEYSFDIIAKTDVVELSDKPAQIDVLSAMDVLTELASRLKSIGWPETGGVFINIANIWSNTKSRKIPNEAIMRVELYSSDNDHMEFARQVLTYTVSKLSRELRTHIGIKEAGHVPPNSMMENHPLLTNILKIHQALHIRSKLRIINDEATVLFSQGIPALSLGITTGDISVENEYIDIGNINRGLKQVIYTLNCIADHIQGDTS